MVAAYPESVAVRWSGTDMTYRELAARANQVAHGLLGRSGAGQEPIALLLPQGPDLIAAIVGVLSVGRPYVPLDPWASAEANARVVDEAGAALTIMWDKTGPGTGITIEALIRDQPADAPPIAIAPDAVAYIYYTSGTTGRPKGVFDSHRNVLHNVWRYTATLGFAPGDRLTLLQGPSFSGAVSSLFGALLNGATSCPWDLKAQGAGRRLAEWVRGEAITVYHSVPLVFRSMLEGGGTFPSVRVVRLEGDAASRLDAELYRTHFPFPCRLVNGLGATETGISCQYFVDHDTTIGEGGLPIGWAAPDMEVILRDERGLEAGAGHVGEIMVRSRYLALGYWRRPDLTDAAFEGPLEGTRTYRSGDLGRRRHDGAIEYLGRNDASLRIRGQRVDPADVEAALTAIPGVREAVAIGRPDRRGRVRLVAYLVPDGGSRPPVASLRRDLKQQLPDPMIPAAFHWLDALPVSTHGKVDRSALSNPAIDVGSRTLESAAPRDALEKQLVMLWEEVLGVSPIGRDDNFFDHGGDSLLAESLLLSLSNLTSWDLPPATLHAAPTIAQLADIIRGDRPLESGVLIPIQPEGTGVPIFILPEHGGRVSRGFIRLGRAMGTDQPVYGIQSAGLSGQDPPVGRIEAIAKRNVELMRRIQPSGPYRLGGRCFGAVVALEMAHQLRGAGEIVDLLFMIDVTAGDFPRLVSEAGPRLFPPRSLREQTGLLWEQALRRKLWKRGPYLVREVGRICRRTGRAFLTREYLRRGAELPRNLWDVSTVNRQSFFLHRSRPWPGRVVLLLHEQPERHNGSRNAAWSRLATTCEVHFLPGPAEAFVEGTHSEAMADALCQALRATGPS
jgi:amino acid adenylation domain-containing protein